MVLDEIEGATVKTVRAGLLKAGRGMDRDNSGRGRLEPIQKPDTDLVLDWVKLYCLFEIYGKPPRSRRR